MIGVVGSPQQSPAGKIPAGRSHLFKMYIGAISTNLFYNPQWGRFMSADTVIDCNTYLGANLYLYCYSDPVNYVDVNGYYPAKVDFQYNISYSLEYQHWNKFRRQYSNKFYNEFGVFETVSCINLTPHQRQDRSAFQALIVKLAIAANESDLSYHGCDEYIEQMVKLTLDIRSAVGIVKLILIAVETHTVDKQELFFVGLGIVYNAMNGTFMIYTPLKNMTDYTLDNSQIENLQKQLIPMLMRINDRYQVTDRYGGNFANRRKDCRPPIPIPPKTGSGCMNAFNWIRRITI